MTDQYCVFGNPIAHSKSPNIHTAFAQQTQQDMVYTKQCVAEGEFAKAAEAFFAADGKGLNITVPFKLDAYEFAARLTSRARRAGAVNTLAVQTDGTVLGDNTDGIGMVKDITDHLGWRLKGKRVLILGAGGAVRGVLQPLLEELPQALIIANRTVSKAQNLAKGFRDLGPIEGCGFDDLAGFQFDVVINGTSASLSGDLPPLPEHLLAPDACCYDMMYAAEPTVFLQWARTHGAAHCADGLGMLVGQAAQAFQLWRSVTPDVAPVLAQMRAEL